MKNKVYTAKQAYIKASKFCAYQERTQQEVRQKLRDLGCYGDEAEEVIAQLIGDNFINEERFATIYAGSKFRLKKWGKIKIEQALRQKGLSEYCICKGLEEIEETSYLQTLKEILEKKYSLIKAENTYIAKNKLSQYALQKGYENDLVWQILKEILK